MKLNSPPRPHRQFLVGVLFALFAALAVLAMTAPAARAQALKVATGSPTGTYAVMFGQINAVCGSELALTPVPTTGSMDNISQLIGNQVNAAFVQSDILVLRAEELGDVKTLLALHSEPVHIVALAESKTKEGGYLGVGSKPVVLTDLASLAGRRVGAAGGSQITAQVIRLKSEVQYQVVLFDTNDQVLAALNAGQIEAGIFVGGQPLPFINVLGPQYKLLQITPPFQDRLKSAYRAAKLNYSKMGAIGVSTVTTDALLVTREYKTAKMVDSLARFRSCALAKIDDLKETTGTHPAWRQVDINNKGKWAYYDLPAPKK